MRTFLWVISIFNYLLILITLALRLTKYEHSQFVLTQILQQYSGETGKLWRKFYKILPEVKTFMWVKKFVLFAVSVALLCYLTHPILGMIYAVIALLILKILSRLKLIQTYSHKLFENNLAIVVGFVAPLHAVWSALGIEKINAQLVPSSREELIDHLQRLPSNVISPQQRQRLEMVIIAEEKTVKQIMTPKKRVRSILSSATLGPVLLSDLEKSKHLHFPVISKNGEVEGILQLTEIGDINQAKQHGKVSDLMSSHTAWVNDDTKLFELVQVVLQEKQHLLFVRDLEDNFVGIITVSDIFKHLIGS